MEKKPEGLEKVEEANRQMKEKRGPAYERWLDGMIRYCQKEKERLEREKERA